jgi:transposase
MFLTNEQWSLIEPLLAPHIPARSGLGRPPIDERLVLDGILWKISHNAAWYDLPPEYPSYQTCFRRYRLWKHLGVLNRILRALQSTALIFLGIALKRLKQRRTLRIE